jgi:hypothetical protein
MPLCISYTANFCLLIFITPSVFIPNVGMVSLHSSQITVKVTMSHMYATIIEVRGVKQVKESWFCSIVRLVWKWSVMMLMLRRWC